MKLFETERLYVTQFTDGDLDNVYAIYGDPVVMQYIRPAISKVAAGKLLNDQLNSYGNPYYYGRFSVLEKDSNRFAGNFVLRYTESIQGNEIGYAFVPSSWGKGYATELTKGGLDFAFNEVGLDKIYAITNTQHLLSQKVLLKCGFHQLPNFTDEGKELCLFEIIKPVT